MSGDKHSDLINLDSYLVSLMLPKLLADKSAERNIIFATDAYGTLPTDEMTVKILAEIGGKIQPRVAKSQEEQQERTRKKAEVFTPSWICNKMNNYCDEEWFGRKNVFNTETEQDWRVNSRKIKFEKEGDWQKYIDSKRLEITCGEAPYIVSRYDTTTGKIIDIKRRIGILDRKLRVVAENTDSEKEWLKWSQRAFESVYGYEFQGDNLLIARINLLNSYVDYMQEKLGRSPQTGELEKITNIICWNIWQMDGIKGTTPFGKATEKYQQTSLFDFVVEDEDAADEIQAVECKIYDWRSKKKITYSNIQKG